jgi:hypothetical protein
MRKQKGIATPSITRFILWDKNYFFRITRELKEYLQSKLPRGDDGLYCCSSPDPTEWSRCWEKTRRFCKKKSFDFDAFLEIFEETVDLFNCESEIANDLNLDKLAHDLGIFSKGESGEDQQCDDCEGRGTIEKGYWDWIRVITRSKTKEQMSWEEIGREESEKMEEYFQQLPEERKEWERVTMEDVRWEYESITDYSEAFPEYLD